MDKKLPRVFASPINKDLTNNKEVFYSSKKESIRNVNVEAKINEIFASLNHVYKSNVNIKTINDEFTTTIVGKTKDYLLTLDGKRINIASILDIDKI